ncbi:hypothetical protein SSX86_032146, partial [Deinandra increscens subsp. villosa]
EKLYKRTNENLEEAAAKQKWRTVVTTSGGSPDGKPPTAVRKGAVEKKPKAKLVSPKRQIRSTERLLRKVVFESQFCPPPKRSWHPLFTHLSPLVSSTRMNVTSRPKPNENPQTETQISITSSGNPVTKGYNNPISVGKVKWTRKKTTFPVEDHGAGTGLVYGIPNGSAFDHSFQSSSGSVLAKRNLVYAVNQDAKDAFKKTVELDRLIDMLKNASDREL